MATKPMTRAQMRELARDLPDDESLDELFHWCLQGILAEPISGKCCCASMLLSEAHRPAGHDGDGTDEP